MGQRFFSGEPTLPIRLIKRYRMTLRLFARPFAATRPHPLRMALLGPPAARAIRAEAAADPMDDIRLFALTFAGGLVFFGTYLA